MTFQMSHCSGMRNHQLGWCLVPINVKYPSLGLPPDLALWPDPQKPSCSPPPKPIWSQPPTYTHMSWPYPWKSLSCNSLPGHKPTGHHFTTCVIPPTPANPDPQAPRACCWEPEGLCPTPLAPRPPRHSCMEPHGPAACTCAGQKVFRLWEI